MKDKVPAIEAIKQAAMEVFLRDGYDGARMQEIADLAGVNKAMLHYYYSSKDILFDTIFSEFMLSMVPELDAIIKSDVGFVNKVKAVLAVSLKHHRHNPRLMSFICAELAKNPERMDAHIQNMAPFNTYLLAFVSEYQAEVEQGKLIAYPTMQLFIIIQGFIDYYHLGKSFFEPFLGCTGVVIDEQFETEYLESACRFIENALIKK